MEGLILRFIALVPLCALLGGCAAVAPLASGLTGTAPSADVEVHSQTVLRLDQGNFVTLRTNAVGRSKGFKLLGFITLYPATLDKAMDRLYADAQAEPGRAQTLAHLIVERSGIYVILFSIPKVTARADLVEFLPPSDENEDSPHSLGLQRVSRPPQRFH